jgi:hypothetical protein
MELRLYVVGMTGACKIILESDPVGIEQKGTRLLMIYFGVAYYSHP